MALFTSSYRETEILAPWCRSCISRTVYELTRRRNGAGLAMNTVDALADAGGKAANFLDTGGKATSETVKKSFQAILKDDRVKVIFVNIFGGLTRKCICFILFCSQS